MCSNYVIYYCGLYVCAIYQSTKEYHIRFTTDIQEALHFDEETAYRTVEEIKERCENLLSECINYREE